MFFIINALIFMCIYCSVKTTAWSWAYFTFAFNAYLIIIIKNCYYLYWQFVGIPWLGILCKQATCCVSYLYMLRNKWSLGGNVSRSSVNDAVGRAQVERGGFSDKLVGCVVLTFSSSYREVTPSRIPVCRSTDSHLSIWISITLGCLCSFWPLLVS